MKLNFYQVVTIGVCVAGDHQQLLCRQHFCQEQVCQRWRTGCCFCGRVANTVCRWLLLPWMCCSPGKKPDALLSQFSAAAVYSHSAKNVALLQCCLVHDVPTGSIFQIVGVFRMLCAHRLQSVHRVYSNRIGRMPLHYRTVASESH